MKLIPAPPLEGHPLPSLDFWVQGHAQIARQFVEKRRMEAEVFPPQLGTAQDTGLVHPHTQDTREISEGRFLSPDSFTGSDDRPSKNSLAVPLQDSILSFLLLCAHLRYPDNPKAVAGRFSLTLTGTKC